MLIGRIFCNIFPPSAIIECELWEVDNKGVRLYRCSMDKNGAKWQHPLRTQEQNAGTDLSRPPPIDQPEEHELPTSSSDASLYDRYAHVIFAYVRLHTPSREDAED